MGFFKNIGADIDIIGLEDTPKPGRISKVNINGKDILFNTVPFTDNYRCTDCVFHGVCAKPSSNFENGLYINGEDVTKKYSSIYGPDCGDNTAKAVIFIKIE